MEQAYKIAAEKSGQCMKRRREAYNRKAMSSSLEQGDRVLVKRLLERGGPVVVIQIEPTGVVYEVEHEDGSG